MTGKIKIKVLKVLLSTSLSALFLLTITNLMGIVTMRQAVLVHSDQLGKTAAEHSQTALEAQVQQQLVSLVEDKAALTDEKLLVIQNQTKMVAEIASHIYTYKDQYRPQVIDYLQPGQVGTTILHLRTAPGVSFNDIRNEVYLAANVGDMLRQITVVDSEITASYIGGEAGYFITVDKGASGPQRTDYEVTSRSWYTAAKEKDGLIWTDIFADSSGRGASISCAMPFYEFSNGNKIFKGVAGSGTSLNVHQIIDSTKIGETGYAFLLNNEKGQVIMSPKITDIRTDENGAIVGEDYLHSNNPELRELVQRMINREKGLMALEMDGAAVYAAYHPLSAINWTLGVVVPIEEVTARARLIEQHIIQLTKVKQAEIDLWILVITLIMGVVILFAVCITFFLALRLSNSLTAPIISLSEGARTVSAGHLDHRLEVKTGDELETLSDTFNQMIDNILYITAEKERISVELNVATKIQASMLPSIFPPFPECKAFDIYAEMHPAKEVGGDFYDFFLVNEDKLAVIIADVSGKGVPAALFMVIAKTLIKNQAQMDKPLNEVFYAVNNQLCENNDTNMFVTAFMGLLEINTGTFTYVNAGHNPPVIKHGDQGFTWLTTKPGIILGAMENMRFKTMETTLSEEDMLFLYTDGVNEAMNPQDQLFGSERILEVLNAGTAKDSRIEDYIRDMLHEIEAFAGNAEQADDITMLILRRNASKKMTPKGGKGLYRYLETS
ncbi:MAG: SpoIIE family protein phosphatase [Treponema sp.]|jgi:sigma-B regulation protein RsbU (phosphoserine phosphatase)|nr:SpoIIE family protein phosphatase [Treponema sp.]